MADDGFHLVALRQALHQADVRHIAYLVEMAGNAHDGQRLGKRDYFAFEIVLGGIDDSNVFARGKAQHFGVFGIIARKRKRKFHLRFVCEHLIV